MSEQNLSASIGSAFQGAVAEHSAPAAPAAPVSEPERAAAPEPDAAPATSQPEGQTATDEANAQPPAEEGAELLTKQEIEALKSNPEALEKAFKGAFTKKTQELAALRKELEPLTQLLQEFKTDPQKTLQLLATQHGMTLTPAQQQAVATTPSEQELLQTALETYDPAQISKAIEQITEKKYQALSEQNAVQVKAQQAADDTLAKFNQKYPDWKQHEQQISQLAAKFVPAKGADGLEYMEMLYHMATKDKTEAQKTKEVLSRMKASAEKSESPNGGVPTSVVAQRPPKPANLNAAFKNAYEDARRGVRYE